MSTVLIVILILLLLGAFGTLPAAGRVPAEWGYYPSGLLFVVVVVILVLALTGRI